MFSSNYIFLSSVINTLIPMLLLSLFNYSIINLVKERELIYRRLTTNQVDSTRCRKQVKNKILFQARDLTATKVLVWIVVNFIFSHSLKVILNIVEIYATLTMNKKGLLFILVRFHFHLLLRAI